MGWQFRYAADQPAMSLDFVLLASQNLNMIIALGILLVGSRKPTSYTYNFLLTSADAELRRGGASILRVRSPLVYVKQAENRLPHNVRFQYDMETK
jgi:hypothetical protein